MGRLKDQIANALAESSEATHPGTGSWMLRRADMYLGDIEQFCSKTFTDQHLEVALLVYVMEEKVPGGEVVTLGKTREGVFVLGDHKIILSRSLSFARTKTVDHDISSATAQPIDMLVEGQARPGFRLNVPDKVPSFAIGLVPPDNVAAVKELRDRIVRALGGVATP